MTKSGGHKHNFLNPLLRPVKTIKKVINKADELSKKKCHVMIY